jgi:two-component system response regulator DegU
MIRRILRGEGYKMLVSSKNIITQTNLKIIYLDRGNNITTNMKNNISMVFNELYSKHNNSSLQNTAGEDWIFYFVSEYSKQEHKTLKYQMETMNLDESHIVLVSINELNRDFLPLLSLPISGMVSLSLLQKYSSIIFQSLLTKGVFLEPDFHLEIILEIERINKKDKPIKNLVLNKEKVNDILTNKEQAILQLILDGHNNGKISEMLFFAKSTVSTAISTIFKKIEANDRTDALVKSIRMGWVDGWR